MPPASDNVSEGPAAFETVPTEAPADVWTGPLVPRLDLEDDGARNIFRPRLSPDELGGDAPVVSIGRPEVLRSLTGLQVPGFERLVPTDFYLIRLWCSFLDPEGDLRFDRAHFKVTLSPSAGADALIAHDLYPSGVFQKVRRDVKVSLSPEAKFMEVEAKIGSFEYGFTYEELQPAVVAAGQGRSDPSWVFSRTKGYGLQGGKAVHLMVAAPEGAPCGEAELGLVVHVTKPGLAALPMAIYAKQGSVPVEPLKVQLW